MKLLAALYRLALGALPRAARRRDRRELERVFREIVSDARTRRGRTAALSRALREMADVFATGLRLRRSPAPSTPIPTPAGRRRDPRLRQALHDFRFAGRALRRRPGYAAVAVLTLGLGLGAATTIVGIADQVLFRPLPYPEPDRLVMIWRVVERFGFDRAPVSYPDFADWRDASRSFEHLSAYTGAQATLLGAGDPALLRGSRVSGDLFAALGRPPLHGRLIGPTDDDPAAPPVVVLSESLWRTRFGADPGAIGRAVRLDDETLEVIGVAPGDLAFPSPDTDYWRPLRLSSAGTERDMNFLHVVGRLAPGVTRERAERELAAVAERVAAEHAGENESDGLWLESRHEYMVGEVRPVLTVLLAAVGALLLLACANVTNLLLARSVERRGELALRAALGAGGGRLGTAVLAEVLILAAGGAAVAALVALGATRLFLALDPVALPRGEAVGVDPRTLLLCTGLALVCALGCGLVALAAGAHRSPAGLLGDTGRTTGDRRSGRLQGTLVVGQVALATSLLVTAGLLGHSLHRLLSVHPGFDGEAVLTARVSPSPAAYPEAEDIDRFYGELLGRLRALPGAEAVGGTWALPFSHVPASWGGPTSASSTYLPDGPGGSDRAADAGAEGTVVTLEPVRGDYFGALGIALLEGRAFTDDDRHGAPPVAVVNRTLARRFWPDGGAVGRRMVKPGGGTTVTVVGVVADVKRTGLDQAAEPVAYLPHRQAVWSHSLFLTVRTAGEPEALARALRAETWSLDPAAAITGVATLSDLVTGSVAAPGLRAAVLAALAGTALVLALVGIYGVLSFAVARRFREMALRLALGAGRRRVVREVVAQGAGWVVVGLILGGAGAAAAAGALRAFLFDLDPLDPVAYLAAGGTLLAAGLVTCWLPARRAAAADPATALREG